MQDSRSFSFPNSIAILKDIFLPYPYGFTTEDGINDADGDNDNDDLILIPQFISLAVKVLAKLLDMLLEFELNAWEEIAERTSTRRANDHTYFGRKIESAFMFDLYVFFFRNEERIYAMNK